MRDSSTSNSQQEAKQALYSSSASSPSLRPYPVSTRAYKKKDYDYLSTFPRMAVRTALRPSSSDAELLQVRSDSESNLSTTASSTEFSTSTSSASSTSSAQSYVKDVIAFVDIENQYQLEHHHHRHLLSTQTSTNSPRISTDCSISHAEADKFDRLHNRSHAEMMDIDSSGIAGDLPSPRQNGSVQVSAPNRAQGKPKPRPPTSTPAVLPKFGSWDTNNPSSGEGYTLIFRRLRDEKKSGGLPVCGSPIHTETKGTVASFQPEGKAKGSLHSNPQAKKKSSRRKAKGTSPREAAYNHKQSSRWTMCCKPSVLND
eukprot:c19317_g1_i1 orf=278-1219(-)